MSRPSPTCLWLCAVLLLPGVVRAETEIQNGSAPAATEPGAVIAVQVEPVIIESEPLEPTREQKAQRFRDLLGEPPSFIVRERRFDSDVLEVTTRVGRFCARPSPQSAQSGPGGDVTLAAPCLSF